MLRQATCSISIRVQDILLILIHHLNPREMGTQDIRH